MTAVAHDHEIPFRFFVPVDLFDLEKGAGIPGQSRRIGGFISTEHEDRQREILLQEGLDFEPFLKSGWFNDNHGQSVSDAVGYPVRVDQRQTSDGKRGTYVEGFLLEDDPKADGIWSKYHALKKAGWPRKLGFSVEGGITHREGPDRRIISRATVRHVAITHVPVNLACPMEALEKAMTAGGEAHPLGPLPAGNIGALRPESLGPKATNAAGPSCEVKKKRKRKRLTKGEAIDLMLGRDIPHALATRIWNLMNIGGNA